jgi:arginine-tRNA-protein transferase
MNSGCRKFGLAFFRPVCQGCLGCRPIRLPAADFRPDRSQRRTLSLNADLTVKFGEPQCDAQRLDLFHRYHLVQQEKKLWPVQPEGEQEYEFSFVRNQIPSTEISVWEGEILRGILITEITPNVVSAVYHYHDTECSERGLGTFLILQCIELARQLAKRWIYLGYYINGCPSMAYKTRYRPCEIMNAEGVWEQQPGETAIKRLTAVRNV